MKIWKKYKDSSLVLKMTAGFVLGILTGIILREKATMLEPLGTIFINLLSLVAIPVIFLTVVLAVNKMNAKQLGRVGGKLVLYYALTTSAAVLIGVTLALWINPGENLTLPNVEVEQANKPSFTAILLQIVPKNIFQAFSAGDVMAIMFTALIIGLAISTMRFTKDEKLQAQGEMLSTFFEALNAMLSKVLKGVLLYAPIGIFGISATAFGGQGFEVFEALFKFTAVFYMGILIHWLVVYSSLLKISGNPVIQFVKDVKEAITMALFTSSSIATLPVAINSAKKAGVSEPTANFALPLGAVFNSDGGALRMGVSIVFAANITNLNLSIVDLTTIVVIGTVLSIGTAGVPAAGLVTLTAILTMFGLPLEIVALIAGVDAIIGMGGTASNVMGDIVGAAVVDRSESKRAARTE